MRRQINIYTEPVGVGYLYIDGEQLRCATTEIGKKWFEEPIAIDYERLQGTHQKVFFYDCLPVKKHNEAEQEFAEKRASKEQFFDYLRAIPGWHVSEGLAKHRKRAGLEQKEVDILIAVDMLTHTYRKNMERLTFLTGDQDFAPLVEAVVRDGMYVHLWYQDGRHSRDLQHFSDTSTPMDLEFLHNVATEEFRRKHPIPVVQFDNDATDPWSVLVAEGHTKDGHYARLWKRDDNLRIAKTVNPVGGGRYPSALFNNETKLKEYFDYWMGVEVDWRPI